MVGVTNNVGDQLLAAAKKNSHSTCLFKEENQCAHVNLLIVVVNLQ